MSARLAIRVEGLVQGVGFRPFVFRLARRHGLAGFVRNETGGVAIEVEGDARSLDGFARDLEQAPPSNARIGRISAEPRPPCGDRGFTIEPSLAQSASPTIPPDVATCDACLRELRDPADRRRGYAFTACADCGPRFTMVRDAPYDRERTSMSAFPLCAACRREYGDPGDRRHHAEATACPDCGPRLLSITVEDAGKLLREGRILAVKGLGGFHLACDAGDEQAVRELRRRKGRDAKPFAVMVADLAAARALGEVSPAEERLLSGPERPVVLLDRRPDAPVAPSVAPGGARLGVLLSYTPLHHLLLAEAGRPLVMTSGNLSDEPIVCRDEDAARDLGAIADGFLSHDREIRSRCDDSVAAVVAGEPLLLRRSRGWAPAPLRLPFRCAAPTLALGGALKSVFALGRGEEAVLSHHLGDLDAYEAWRAYVDSIGLYERLFRFSPEVVVHDLHPDYPSTRYALERVGVRRVAVQHHHAHMASCMAENGLAGPVIGVTFDGTGYGSDGTIWGGEFLVGDYSGVRRAAHFESVPMPGGEAAIREPWRMAAAVLEHGRLGVDVLRGRIGDRALEIVRRLDGPRTSSCGRLFDAAAAILGLRDRVSYEGQAAVELEALAETSAATGAYPVELSPDGAIRLAPLFGALLEDLGAPKADVARRFHATAVEAIRKVCARLREETGLDRVVLSGGVFVNRIVLAGALEALGREGFRVHRHRLVPPNDGGLCLGQLAVAAARAVGWDP